MVEKVVSHAQHPFLYSHNQAGIGPNIQGEVNLS